MSTTKIEFAVQMTCDSCVNAVKKSLEDVPGIEHADVNLERGTVVVNTTLRTEDVQRKIEASGRKAVVKGYEGSVAGVAILDTGATNIQGVVRFIQIAPNVCVIDGTVDGLQAGQYGLFVNETGDLSRGCESTGQCYSPNNHTGRLYGNLGTVTSGADGRAIFRLEDNVIKLSDIIGRSLVLTEHSVVENMMGKKLVCGIIARSSGLFENPKTICACDGISIWDERNSPKSAL